MPLAIKTPDDHASSVEVSEVGAAGAFGTNPVRLSRLAAIVPALQDADGKPLADKELEAAAKQWVAGRSLEVANVKESEFSDPGIDIRDFATEPETEPAPEPQPAKELPAEAASPAAPAAADTPKQTPAATAGDTKGKTA